MLQNLRLFLELMDILSLFQVIFVAYKKKSAETRAYNPVIFSNPRNSGLRFYLIWGSRDSGIEVLFQSRDPGV